MSNADLLVSEESSYLVKGGFLTLLSIFLDSVAWEEKGITSVFVRFYNFLLHFHEVWELAKNGFFKNGQNQCNRGQDIQIFSQ